MAAKKKTSFSSVEEELKYLKKQNAGLKGQIGLLNFQKRDLNKCIDRLRDEVARNETIASELRRRNELLESSNRDSNGMIRKLKEELIPLQANVEYYNELPWYRKMFTFRIH